MPATGTRSVERTTEWMKGKPRPPPWDRGLWAEQAGLREASHGWWEQRGAPSQGSGPSPW